MTIPTLALAVFIFLVVCGLPLSSVAAQTIRLKNGNTLHGEVEYPDEHQVVVDIPGVGKLTFAKHEIASIEEPAPEPVQEEDHDPLLTGGEKLVNLDGEWRRFEAAEMVAEQLGKEHLRQQAIEQPDLRYKLETRYNKAKEAYRKAQSSSKIGDYQKAVKEAQYALDYFLKYGVDERAASMKELIQTCRTAIYDKEHRFQQAINKKQLMEGMTKDHVTKSWGRPYKTEKTKSGTERWSYGYWRQLSKDSGYFVETAYVEFDTDGRVTYFTKYSKEEDG